jgi:hypothetical protein
MTRDEGGTEMVERRRRNEALDLDAVDIRRGDGTRVSNGDVSRMMAEARESVRDMTDGEPRARPERARPASGS